MTDQENNNASEWQKRKMGALWRKEGKTQNYLSGEITIGEFGVEKTYRLVIYTNKFKDQNENAPDFLIYQSKSKDEIEEDQNEIAPSAPSVSSEIAEEVPDLLQ